MAEDNIGSGMPDLSGIMDIISKNPELLGKAASILGEMKSGGESPLSGFDPSMLGNLFSGGAPTSGGNEKGEGLYRLRQPVTQRSAVLHRVRTQAPRQDLV